MISKRTKMIVSIVLALMAIAIYFFLENFLKINPVGEAQIEEFSGGPNMKEVSDSLTEQEKNLYQYVENHQGLVKMFFLDVSGDSINELLTFERTKLQGRDAHKISLVGINVNLEIKILKSWTVMNYSDIGRIAIFLHPEEDGSYTVVEDSSVGGDRLQTDELNYCRYKFRLDKNEFEVEILEQEKGKAKDKKEEYFRLEKLIEESILVYDTFPSARLTQNMIE